MVFGSKHLYITPKIGCNAVRLSRYTEPYEPTSSRALNSVNMVGTATPVLVISMASNKVPRQRAMNHFAEYGYIRCGFDCSSMMAVNGWDPDSVFSPWTCDESQKIPDL